MRHLWPTLLMLLIAAPLSHAGENKLGAGCTILTTSPTVGTSSDDATDCTWGSGKWIALQCDFAVYYSSDNTTPTAANPKVTVGDPYPIKTQDSSAGTPLKVLGATASATTCQVFVINP